MADQTLVIINLRGGADGLNMVVPYREENYYRLRPTIAIPTPNQANGAIDLDGFFGLNPALAPLLPLYQNKQLAILNAVGWPGDSHSHFEAWEEIELGAVGEQKPTTGWLSRYLTLVSDKSTSPLQTINFSDWPSKLFIGCSGTSKLTQLSDFRLAKSNPNSNSSNMLSCLKTLYGNTRAIGKVAEQSISALETVEEILKNSELKPDKSYPQTKFGEQLSTVEQLIKANVGLKATSIDLYGWDSHFGQKLAMAEPLTELSKGLVAFANNLQQNPEQWQNVTVVVMTEFGRRVSENASFGTDHGQAGVMFFIGGRVKGGRVYGDWPGLADDKLSAPGDLTITTDFRTALSETIISQIGAKNINKVFPAHQISKQLSILN